MMNCCKITCDCLLLLTLLLLCPYSLSAQSAPDDGALIEALQRGGYNLYFRHEATDWSQYDNVRQRDDWLSCKGAEIRQLSEEGRQGARRTGRAMRNLAIPVSEVLASPYCRAMETARELDLGKVRASTAVINLRVAEYYGGRAAVVATARKLLAQKPPAGSNRVIVAHGNVAREATPVYPGEGEAVIFRPDGENNFTFVGRLPPERWVQLEEALN